MKPPPCPFERNLDKMKILSMEIRAALTPESVRQKLIGFFGPGGLGLALKEEGPGCATFEGGGGYVMATFCREGEWTVLRLVTSEWAVQVKRFIETLP